MNIAEGDVLGWASVSRGHDQILLVSSSGQAIRFEEDEVRPMGLSAGGVLGIRFEEGRDVRVVGMDCLRADADLLLVREDGHAKRVALGQFPIQGRHGKGVLAWKSAGGAQLAGAALGVEDDRVAVHQARGAARSLRVGDAPRRSRGAAGKALIEVKDSDRVVRITSCLPRVEVMAPPKPEPAPGKRAAKKAKTAAKASARRPARKPAGRKPARKSPAGASHSEKPGSRAKASGKKARGGR
jgi:DNA gyrase subunit A